MDSKETILTKAWIEKIVIGLDLCPFAKFPYFHNKIRYKVYYGKDLEQLTSSLVNELLLLDKIAVKKVETTLLIIPNMLADFFEFCDYLSLAEQMLQELHLDGILQIASFHPNYQFAETKAEDIRNYTNKSPFPMLHLLREQSVKMAIQNHPDTSQIPVVNQQLMLHLGVEYLRNLWNDIISTN